MMVEHESKFTRLSAALIFAVIAWVPLASHGMPQAHAPSPGSRHTPALAAKPSSIPPAENEQAVLSRSQEMWRWMSERNTEALSSLYHDKAMFVHMSRTLSKSAELDVIRTGSIQYKKIDIQETSVRLIGNTAIVLTKMRLGAVVRDNEVSNPFMVTEVYVQQGQSWLLASLAFTRLVGD